MSCGCAIAANDTAPVREVIAHQRTGRLVDFFDYQDIADQVCHLLAQPEERELLGKAARQMVLEKYDLRTICLPQQLQWLADLRTL